MKERTIIFEQVSLPEVPFGEQPKHRKLKSQRNMRLYIAENKLGNYDTTERLDVLLQKPIPLPQLEKNDSFQKKYGALLTAWGEIVKFDDTIANVAHERSRRRLLYS